MTKVLFDLLSQSGSIVPIRSGKGSDPGWNEFQTKAPTPEELDAWITSGDYEGYALMMGYGGYHVIDVDTKNASEEVKRDLFQKVWTGVPSHLQEKLTVQRTRSGGEHIIYRCPTPTYPEKLITNPISSKVVVEAIGPKNYVLISPSPGYEVVSGSLSEVPTITPDEQSQITEHCCRLGMSLFGEPEVESNPISHPCNGIRISIRCIAGKASTWAPSRSSGSAKAAAGPASRLAIRSVPA